ncbi:MAG: BatD family protein [Flavobacteriales bacterium]|nr:BatD family protein [Flavobacteriales bacterium]MDG1781037.1 BatD family protein [Flavobacteriales bacterium]MDG2245783.1 BatD family protein [Flavobacteriales bacterium]
MKNILILLFLSCICLPSLGQSASASVNKNPVKPGEAFKFTISIDGIDGDVRMRQIKGLQFLGGPAIGQQFQSGNGRRSKIYSYSYTFRAPKEGTYEMPAVEVVTSKGTFTTSPFNLKVTNKSEGSNDFFLVLQPSKKEVFVGEPITLKYNVYQRYRNFQIDQYELPDLKGFWSENVADHQGQWANVSVNGKTYQMATLKVDVLFPQQSGELIIDNFSMNAVVGNFFNNQKISAKASSIKIDVKPLPAGKPNSFLGTFKKLSMTVSTSAEELKANEALTVKVEFTGTGNMKLIPAPVLDWPEDLEVYDPEIRDRISVTANGISGKRSFEYVVIPRSAGTYTLPDFSTSYFKSASAAYTPLRWEQVILQVVENADGVDVNYAFNGKTDVQILNQDIRYIKPKPKKMKLPGSIFFGSLPFYLLYGSPFALFIFSLIARSNRKKKMADVSGYKQKRAGKTMKKWLNEAKKHDNDPAAFYGALQNGLEQYLMDKFFLERSKLSRETIATRLGAYASEEATTSFLALWDKTVMARFAPISTSEIAGDLDKANAILTEIESVK